MAALSGLTAVTASHSHVLASGRANEEVTWASLCKRQQRVISGMGEVDKRLRQMELRLATKFGWTTAQAQPKPTVEGPEWAALRQRQQDLLENICSVKDRMKALGFRCGITNAAHAESVAKPHLMKKVPSHFNNNQLAEFIRIGHAVSSSLSPPTPTFPLTKLLIMVLTRDVRRFVTSGAYRPVAEMVPGLQPAESIPADGTAEEKQSEDACVRILFQHFLFLLCALTMDASTATRTLADGQKLLILSNSIDSDSRMILQDEPYVVDPAAKHDNLAHSPALVASLDAFHSKQSRSWFASGVSPFASFKFTRPPSLLASTERTPCPKCRKPCSLYCSACLVPTLPEELQIPEVKLPLHVDIVHHVGENVKKSTSIHCCILSPSSCRFLEFPADLPPYDPASTILLYPTSDALYLDDPRLDLSRVRTMVVIESTWVKSDIVSQHPALVGLQRVKIRQRESTFWRYQELGRQFLATLEAIYWTQEECRMRRRKEAEAAHAASDPLLADGAIDDLLYFYAFQHEVITQRYRTSSDLQPPRSWSGRGGAAPGAGEHK